MTGVTSRAWPCACSCMLGPSRPQQMLGRLPRCAWIRTEQWMCTHWRRRASSPGCLQQRSGLRLIVGSGAGAVRGSYIQQRQHLSLDGTELGPSPVKHSMREQGLFFECEDQSMRSGGHNFALMTFPKRIRPSSFTRMTGLAACFCFNASKHCDLHQSRILLSLGEASAEPATRK